MQNHPTTTGQPSAQPDPSGPSWPPGNHPLEIAARRGIGPLSTLGDDVWHGHARPCVSCGQLVRRDVLFCDHCGQDLSPAMIEKMRAVAGPWYVYEHVRPFPGVNLERIIRQIRRGVISETSIVRGPATDYQWRFAAETPGLCRFFGRCWQCHEQVIWSETQCPNCAANLTFDQPRLPSASAGGSTAQRMGEHGSAPTQSSAAPPERLSPASAPAAHAVPPTATAPTTRHIGRSASTVSGAAVPASEELRRLTAAVGQAGLPAHEPVWEDPPRIAGIRATWIAAILLAIGIVVLMWLTWTRSAPPAPPRSEAVGMAAPAVDEYKRLSDNIVGTSVLPALQRHPHRLS